jgi:hypothetical protein
MLSFDYFSQIQVLQELNQLLMLFLTISFLILTLLSLDNVPVIIFANTLTSSSTLDGVIIIVTKLALVN